MSLTNVTAIRWACDYMLAGPACMRATLTTDCETPPGWVREPGMDICPACVDTRGRASQDAALAAELDAAAKVLNAAGLPVVPHRWKRDTLVANVTSHTITEPAIEVRLYPEGKARRAWRAVAALPGGRSLNTASPDLGRLAARVLKECSGK